MIELKAAALCYLAAANAVTFAAFGIDKSCARGGSTRVPEMALLLPSLLGGFLGGALGMLAFRHKTRKASFLAAMAVIFLIDAAAVYWLFGRYIGW